MFRKYQTEDRRAALTLGGRTLVLRPRDVADVRAAVRVASGAGLPLAVLSPDHDTPSLGDAGGFVLDLRHLSDVEMSCAEEQLSRRCSVGTRGLASGT